jgi:hypothetical protein
MVSNLGNLGFGVGTDHSGKNDECFTPPEIFEALAIDFDLDVCAPVGGVAWVPAKRHYTIHDDALTQKWEGRVWMNPPFSNVRHFAPRFREHANGIALVPTSNGKWMYELWSDTRTHWIQLNKPRFIRPDGTRWDKSMPTRYLVSRDGRRVSRSATQTRHGKVVKRCPCDDIERPTCETEDDED